MAEVVLFIEFCDEGHEEVDDVLHISHIRSFHGAVHVAEGEGEIGGGHT